MKIAIPTHQRSHLITQMALAFLERNGIPHEDVDLFVSDEQEAWKYKQNTMCNVVYHQDLPDLTTKFNFIHTYYPPGTNVLVLEDDLIDVKQLVAPKVLQPVTNIKEHADCAFRACSKNSTALWGINSNSNHFFMKPQVYTGFKFIVANLYGFIATKTPVIVQLPTKTDYERTIRYYNRYGSVIRLDYLCPITKNYRLEGGIATEGRKELEDYSVKQLVALFPHLCKRNTSKDSMYAEISLRIKADKA